MLSKASKIINRIYGSQTNSLSSPQLHQIFVTQCYPRSK